jgi:peptide/nickel transport system permease protein
MTSDVLERGLTGATQARRRVVRNPKVLAGLAILAAFCLLAVAHPVLQATVWSTQPSVYRPEAGHDPAIAHPSGPAMAHPLGTDALGRDVLSLLTFSLAPTLLVALVVAVTVGVCSLLAGSAAAYFRGKVDGVLSNLAYGLMLLPPPLILLVVGVGRPDFGPPELGLIYGLLFGLGASMIVVRSRALTVMAKPFVDAAQVAGGRPHWIIGTHLIPHLLPYSAVQMMAGVTGALITQGFVEFLGAAETRIGLGSLVYLGLSYRGLVTQGVAWTQLLAGALSISLLAASFYLMSVGLRESIDTKIMAER